MLPAVVSVGFTPKNNSGGPGKSSRGILEVKYGLRFQIRDPNEVHSRRSAVAEFNETRNKLSQNGKPVNFKGSVKLP